MTNEELLILRGQIDEMSSRDLRGLKIEIDNCLKFREFQNNGGCDNCGSINCPRNYIFGCGCAYFKEYLKYPTLAIGDYVEVIEFTSTDGRILWARGTIVCSNDEEFGKDDEYWVSIATYGGFYKIKRKRNEIRKL